MASGQLNARHWIGGEWVDSEGRLDSVNPATGETIGTYASGGEAEATKAIAVAKQAFLNSNWRENRRLRAKAIIEMADCFEARMDDLV
jgi:betaine-aldehyde dehydrogenase